MSSVTTAPRALLLALSNWFGAPRLPKALERAGFHVTVFAFPGLLIQRAGSIAETLLAERSVSADQLTEALLDAIERSRASIVIPTDDTSILLLHAAEAVAKRTARPRPVLEALADSLGDPKHFSTVRSRKLLATFAAQADVRQPRHSAIFSEQDAIGFAAQHGYPVVLKEEESVAGMGVFICKDEAELRKAIARSSQEPATFGAGLLAQTFVEGRPAMRVVAALRGRVVGGLSAIKLETWPRSTGPSSCVELFAHAEIQQAAEVMINKLGYSGLASLDFMLDAIGQAHLIELNARATPIAHLGERFGGCLFRHLHAALLGQPSQAGEPRGLPSTVALFPQEWVRDQSSPHLSSGVFHDVPWDEPDLVEAYMMFGRGQMRWGEYDAADLRNEALRVKLGQFESSAPPGVGVK